MFCVFSITTGEFVVAGLLPTVAADLGTSVGTAGLVVPAYALGMIVGGPLLTALTAHLRRRPLMVALLGVAVVGNAASAAAPTPRTARGPHPDGAGHLHVLRPGRSWRRSGRPRRAGRAGRWRSWRSG